MKIGSIYVYRDPRSDRPMYVGSTQDGNTMRRHREHLKEKGLIGPWLRSFAEPPVPIEIRKFKFENVKRLHACENHFMFILGTFMRGLNKVRAGQMPRPTIEDCKKGGKKGGIIAGRKSVESGRWASFKTRDHQVKAGLKGAMGLRENLATKPELLMKFQEQGHDLGSKYGREGGLRTFELHGCTQLNTARSNAKKRFFHMGRKRSTNTCAKISEKAKLRIGNLNPFFGKQHYEETKEKISIANSGINHPFFGKKRPDHAEKMRQSWAKKKEGRL